MSVSFCIIMPVEHSSPCLAASVGWLVALSVGFIEVRPSYLWSFSFDSYPASCLSFPDTGAVVLWKRPRDGWRAWLHVRDRSLTAHYRCAAWFPAEHLAAPIIRRWRAIVLCGTVWRTCNLIWSSRYLGWWSKETLDTLQIFNLVFSVGIRYLC